MPSGPDQVGRPVRPRATGATLWARIPGPWRPLLLLVPITAALLLRGLLNSAPTPSRRPPPLVQTAPVERGSMEERYPVSAEVKPLVSVEVRPEVSGTIQRLYFEEGTEVRRGDPLALINPTPYQVALDQARANTSRARARIGEAQAQRRLAEAQLHLASDRARRYGGLSRQGALSRDDEENYRTQELVARANLEALKGSAASAEAELAAARAAEAAARCEDPEVRAVLERIAEEEALVAAVVGDDFDVGGDFGVAFDEAADGGAEAGREATGGEEGDFLGTERLVHREEGRTAESLPFRWQPASREAAQFLEKDERCLMVAVAAAG